MVRFRSLKICFRSHKIRFRSLKTRFNSPEIKFGSPEQNRLIQDLIKIMNSFPLNPNSSERNYVSGTELVFFREQPFFFYEGTKYHSEGEIILFKWFTFFHIFPPVPIIRAPIWQFLTENLFNTFNKQGCTITIIKVVFMYCQYKSYSPIKTNCS